MEQLIPQGSTIAKTIRNAVRRGTMSHALILYGTGPLTAAARYAAAAMLCRSDGEKPCLHCVACHKVLEDIHPDVHIVSDDEHKELKVESVRELRRDVYIRPNEGERKIYIFPHCDQLNERDQNVLLKIVEEGPDYAAFIFCARSAADLLPTVRSRCVTWKMNENEETTEVPEALELCRHLSGGSALEIAEYLVSLENRRMKREQVQELFCACWRVAAEALLMQRGKTGVEASLAECAGLLSRSMPGALLQRLTALCKKYADECNYNVGAGHILGAFAADCEDLMHRM